MFLITMLILNKMCFNRKLGTLRWMENTLPINIVSVQRFPRRPRQSLSVCLKLFTVTGELT